MHVGRASTLLVATITAAGLISPAAASAKHKPDPIKACQKAAKADKVSKSVSSTACGQAAGGDYADCTWQIMSHSASNTDSTARDVCKKAAPKG